MTPASSHRDEPAGPRVVPPAPPPRFVLGRDAVRRVDRTAIEEYGIPGIVLMENAARGLADEARQRLEATGSARVIVVCGRGNNGGDGYALARHLHNAGLAPRLATLGVPRPGSDAAVNASICRRMGLPIDDAGMLATAPAVDLVVDAVFGTGLDRAVTGPAADAIAWMNEQTAPVLAVDVPSGLDCDTGRPLGPTVRAACTVTFVAPKPGFLELDAQPFVGEVVVADIGAPAELVERFGRALPPAPADDRSETAVPPVPPRR
jgi:NAD(P)H-hydrate epimerase